MTSAFTKNIQMTISFTLMFLCYVTKHYFSKVSPLGLDTVTLRLEGPAIIIIISIIIIMLEFQMMLIPCVMIQICFVYELSLQLLHKQNFQG